MILAYGSIPRPARIRPAHKKFDRSEAIETGREELLKGTSKRRKSFGLRHFKGTRVVEQSADVLKLPAGAPVLIYRTRTNRWERPFNLISIEIETVVVKMPCGRRISRPTFVELLIIS